MRRWFMLLSLAGALVAHHAAAQTYECSSASGTNCRAAIPDGGQLVSTLSSLASDCPPGTTVADVNVQIEILHDWLGDLEITLANPTGTTQVLYFRPGGGPFGCATDDIDAVFSDEGFSASYDKCSSVFPTVGGFVFPSNPLSVFDGGTRNGTWTLTIKDHLPGGAGMLSRWALELPCVVPTVTVTASDNHASEVGVAPGAFTFSRGTANKGDLVVNFTRSGTASFRDATVVAPVVIPHGSTSATLAVTPLQDGLIESVERVSVALGPGEYGIGSPSSAQVAVFSDDADFNLDGKPDLLWRNYATGQVNVWFLNGTAYAGGQSLFTVANPDWLLESTGDFNLDGKTDLIWRNVSTGAVNVWFLNGTTYMGGANLFTVADPNWEIEAAGDLNDDGRHDLIWRNYATGAVNVWFLNGTTYLGGATLFTVADPNWKIEAAGDFNGDARVDLIWRNYATGQVNVWFLNGTTYLGGASLFTVADPDWNIEAVGDYNLDGKLDLIWRNYATGAVNAWFLNGTSYLGGSSLFSVADPNWKIAGPR